MNQKIIKINLLLLVWLASVSIAVGQDSAAVDPNFWQATFGNMTLITGVIVIAAAFFTILRLFTVFLKMEELRILREKGIEEIVEQYRQPEKSWWKKFIERMEGVVPIEQEHEILFDHEYDGIRELDNKLPPWWVWMFYITIFIACGYWYVYQISDIGLSSAESYKLEMQEAEKSVKAYLAKQQDAVTETNVKLLTDPDDLLVGEAIYKNLCVACHGQNGEGLVGPNFTDEYWVHGGDIKDLFKTIKYGVPEKGMISWSAQLRPSDMQKVASFILTFQGTNPPNQKEPEGEIWKPEEEVAQDSTQTIDM